MTDYQLTATGVLRTADNAYIPDAPLNSDWQRYQLWLADGNTPDPMPEPEVYVPQSVTISQVRLALASLGMTEAQIDKFIENAAKL